MNLDGGGRANGFADESESSECFRHYSGPAEPVGQVGQLPDQYFRHILLLFILTTTPPNVGE